jgi:nitroreductase
MELLDVLRTTGAIREFRSEPVADEVIFRILDAARFAPSGGNRQSWRVVVLRDPAMRAALRDVYLVGWKEYLAQVGVGLVPFAPLTDQTGEAAAIASAASTSMPLGAFSEHLDEVPVLLLVFADLRLLAAVDKYADRYTFAGGASVYPFVWSMLLAARAEGLGGVITTMPIRYEADVLSLVGVPPEFALAAVVALGVPVRQPRRLTRRPVAEFATFDRFDGPPLSG